MGNYTIFTEISNGIVKLLREKMVPEVIENPDQIGLCNPEQRGDLALGIWLYDIQKSEGLFSDDFKDVSVSSQNYPSQFFDLYYMLTAYSESDLKFKAVQEQKILGKAAQVFLDCKILSEEYLDENPEIPVKMELEQISCDNKMKIYNVPNSTYQLSLFCKVYPIELESTRKKKVRRVLDMDISVKEAEKKGGRK